VYVYICNKKVELEIFVMQLLEYNYAVEKSLLELLVVSLESWFGILIFYFRVFLLRNMSLNIVIYYSDTTKILALNKRFSGKLMCPTIFKKTRFWQRLYLYSARSKRNAISRLADTPYLFYYCNENKNDENFQLITLFSVLI